jgi:hypothetical protein
VLSFVSSSVKVHLRLMSLVDDRNSIPQRFSGFQLKHTFGEANKCVDALPNLGRSQFADLLFIFLISSLQTYLAKK